MNQLATCLLLLSSAHIYLAVDPVQSNFRLQILHNNDLQARFVETDENTAPCPEEFVKQNKCYGGFARMKKAADKAREDAKIQGIPTIFLNAGDSFVGTPYYTVFKWEIVSQLIDKLGMDAMALGDQEFNDGIDNLAEYLKHTKTPVVCANIDATKEKDLSTVVPSIILPVDVGEEKMQIGVIGYLTPRAKRLKTGKLEFFDEIPAIQSEVKRLKSEGVKIIIALGHSGYDDDLRIAKEVEGLSLVVGGNSYHLLHNPKDKPPSVEDVTDEYPVIVTQKSGKIVPVVQVYGFSKYLGKLIVEFDTEGNVLKATGNSQLLDSSVEKDHNLDQEISKWTEELKKHVEGIKEIKGYTRTSLDRTIIDEGKFESNLANLITDAFVDAGVQMAKDRKESTWTKTPIAFYPNGGVRVEINRKRANGALTLEDLMYIMPFKNPMFELTARGSAIRQFLENSVSAYDEEKADFDPKDYIQFSGLRVKYDFTKPSGQRVESVDALCQECEVPEFRALEDNTRYGIITVRPEASKFENLETENINKTELSFKDVDALTAYIERKRVVAPILDNRVIVTGFKLKHPTSTPGTESNIMTETQTVENQ